MLSIYVSLGSKFIYYLKSFYIFLGQIYLLLQKNLGQRQRNGRQFIQWFLLMELLIIGEVVSSKVNMPDWKAEIDRSLERNIRFCPYKYADQTNSSTAASSNEFLIKRIFPSKHELRPFQELPVSLTKAHRDFALAASERGYNFQKWGSETESRWEVPSNHPGQDKKNCINMTQLVSSEGKIYALYESFKKVDRAFYVGILKQGFVHPSGAVMASCGYYMGEELCENRWDYAKDWHTKCKAYLKKRQYSWKILFDPALQTKLSTKDWEDLIEGCADNTELGKPAPQKKFKVRKEEKVFVMPALWDYNYHHFMADSLARLARHYDFLKKHPDVKIHLRFFEDYDPMRRNNRGVKAQARRMRENLLSFLGFNLSRIVTGPILAQEVYIPRALRCSYALSNPLEIRLLTRHFLSNLRYFLKVNYPSVLKFITSSYTLRKGSLSGSGKLYARGKKQSSSTSLEPPPSPPHNIARRLEAHPNKTLARSLLTILPDSFFENSAIFWPPDFSKEFISQNNQKLQYLVILQRFQAYTDDRNWDDATYSQIIRAFAQAFPSHGIIPLSSKRYSQKNYCLACDLLLMTQSNVLVGAHGAGLTNMMFFPTNSLVVEMVGQPMDVNMPVCGYYGPYGAIFGHHHYIYAHLQEKNWPILAQQAADEASSFFQFIRNRNSDEFVIPVYNSTNYQQCRP